jgi:hypothetical protein
MFAEPQIVPVGGGFYYGCDSNTGCFVCGSQFYIGKMGEGVGGGSIWNSSAAANATYSYGYWGLHGPLSDPNYNGTTSEAFAWGQTQGNAAIAAWKNLKAKYPNLGLTVFVDIETGFGGWASSGSPLNQQVYQGFLFAIQYSTLGLIPGVYSSINEWSQIMGSSYSASPAQVEWAASWLSSCNTCPTSFPVSSVSFGGLNATIWQYQGCTGRSSTGGTCSCPSDCSTPSCTPQYCFYDLDLADTLPS